MNRSQIDDTHFHQFAANLRQTIDSYGDLTEEEFQEKQRAQIETLLSLEDDFRETLIQHPWGPGVYRGFVHFICDEKRNILAARPFFRERQPVFTKRISKALKAKADKALYKFHFNYQFVRFVLGHCRWNRGSKIVRLAKEIERLRVELVELNMPLAISRARIFWSRTPKSQLAYMDMIQISCEGLMAAIDKFVLPPKYKAGLFSAVAIGRILGNLIEDYSETLVHFYPTDKKKIYRANKLVGKHRDGVDFEVLANQINKDMEPGHLTNSSEIANLMAAASTVSTDSTPPVVEDDGIESQGVNRFAASAETQPDVMMEKVEAMSVMELAITELNMTEQKLLKMKGVSI